jgi:hypothetical protein
MADLGAGRIQFSVENPNTVSQPDVADGDPDDPLRFLRLRCPAVRARPSGWPSACCRP